MTITDGMVERTRKAKLRKIKQIIRKAAIDALFNGAGKIINPEIFDDAAGAALEAALSGEKGNIHGHQE